MAVLSDNDRANIAAKFQRIFSNVNGGAGVLTKADIRAWVNAVDDWRDANASAHNSAIPQPARSAASTKQKVSMLKEIIDQAYEVA